MKAVQREGGVSVIAEPRIKAKKGIFTALVGAAPDYEYSTRFQSETPTGRPIIFDEVYGSRNGSEYGFADSRDRALYGFADSRDRESYALKTLLTADDKLQRVRQRLPNVETKLIGEKGITMDEATRQKMYKDAEKHNLSSFSIGERMPVFY